MLPWLLEITSNLERQKVKSADSLDVVLLSRERYSYEGNRRDAECGDCRSSL